MCRWYHFSYTDLLTCFSALLSRSVQAVAREKSGEEGEGRAEVSGLVLNDKRFQETRNIYAWAEQARCVRVGGGRGAKGEMRSRYFWQADRLPLCGQGHL